MRSVVAIIALALSASLAGAQPVAVTTSGSFWPTQQPGLGPRLIVVVIQVPSPVAGQPLFAPAGPPSVYEARTSPWGAYSAPGSFGAPPFVSYSSAVPGAFPSFAAPNSGPVPQRLCPQ